MITTPRARGPNTTPEGSEFTMFTPSKFSSQCRGCRRTFIVSLEAIAKSIADCGYGSDAEAASAIDICLRCATGAIVPDEIPNTVARLATAFSAELVGALPFVELLEVNQRNRDEQNGNICHSHDFIDANECMSEAFFKVMGRLIDFDGDEDFALINQAWTVAKASDFGQKVGSGVVVLDAAEREYLGSIPRMGGVAAFEHLSGTDELRALVTKGLVQTRGDVAELTPLGVEVLEAVA